MTADHDGIVGSWERAARRKDARGFIHPLGRVSDDDYEASGAAAALRLQGQLERGEVIVDFGDGRVTVPLHDAGYHVIAVDASPTMIERLRARRPMIPAIVSSAEGLLEALGAPVDAIFALAVLIHHSHADAAALIAELGRALRPGGRLLLDLPLYETSRERAGWVDVSVWTLDELSTLAGNLDLEILEAPVSPGAFRYSAIGAHHGDLVVLRQP